MPLYPLIEEQIFGESSTLYQPSGEVAMKMQRVVAMSDELSYEVAVLLFVILYFFWIGRSLSNLDGLTFRISNPFAPIREAEGLGGSRRIGDILLDWTLVTVTLAIFITRLVDLTQLHYSPMVDIVIWITEIGVWQWLGIVILASLAVRAWGWIVVRVMGEMMRVHAISNGLIMTKNRLLKMMTVWLMPLVVMSALEGDNFWIAYTAVTVVVIFTYIYLFRSLMLFIGEKNSILHWILYLCTGEIFPITLILGLFVRWKV